MDRAVRSGCLLGACALALACGGEPAGAGGDGPGGGISSPQPTGGGGARPEGGAPSQGGMSSQGGADPSGGSSTGGAAEGGAGEGGAVTGFPGLASLGTLVVLGDSIGDGGGVSPFYYDLLRTQLTSHYGAIDYRRNAESGSKTGALVGQIDDLPGSLAGPVAVVVTSGGNDMKAALPQIVLGADAGARQTMRQNIDAALDDLLAPGRFGAGVEVFVFQATIYDASDGQGDFGQNGCAFGQGLPAIPTDGFFANWNAVISEEVSAHGQILMDVHGHFDGHGYHGSPNWYASDCTHPNALGHQELADLFYGAITGG